MGGVVTGGQDPTFHRPGCPFIPGALARFLTRRSSLSKFPARIIGIVLPFDTALIALPVRVRLPVVQRVSQSSIAFETFFKHPGENRDSAIDIIVNSHLGLVGPQPV